MMLQRTGERVFRVGHVCCGIGAGAKGFNDARPRIGHIRGRFECAGGIDNDAGALRNFEKITGAKGTLLDLFDREQYEAFHGHAPAPDWREATPADYRAAFGANLHVLFVTAPCKGFSGLLSAKASQSEKYQALNRLTLRAIWLALEAYKDNPVDIVAFENVPRIMTRGDWLMTRIKALFRAHGYALVDDKGVIHDCGELGGLAQHRRRYLLVARHMAKVPPFLYQPAKSRVRGVGEVIGKLPLPGAVEAGPMHRVPRLQWRTWVRLAFVPAGKDWRALNDLAVENGALRDFGIVPVNRLHNESLGVTGWADPAPTLTSQRAPGQGRFSVADPRPVEGWQADVLGVRDWDRPTGTVPGRSGCTNGAHSVADPRQLAGNLTYQQYGVRDWQEPAGTVTGQCQPGGGPNSVADPRSAEAPRFDNTFRIVPFAEASAPVADPRPEGAFAGAGKYRVTAHDEPTGTVIAGSTTGQGAFALADPRPTHGPGAHGTKHRVVGYADASPVVTGSDRVGSGALSVADPRPGYRDAHHNILRVTPYDAAAGTVTSASHPAAGAIVVADPRPVCLNAPERTGYATQGHYGVLAWDEASNAVPGYAKYDRGNWSVADPRATLADPMIALPAPGDRLVARIIAQDGTWHRPFTTLELAALQSLFDPGEVFDLEGGSDQMKREWIGNAVPSAAARAMAETIGETLLLADLGETFVLSSREIWAKPLALALAVDPRQPIDGMDA